MFSLFFFPFFPLAVAAVAAAAGQANGHLAVAKALRGRLSFVRGQALRARLAQDKDGAAAAAADGATGGAADAADTAPSSDRQFDETLAA